jgi:hypothetical protein
MPRAGLRKTALWRERNRSLRRWAPIFEIKRMPGSGVAFCCQWPLQWASSEAPAPIFHSCAFRRVWRCGPFTRPRDSACGPSAPEATRHPGPRHPDWSCCLRPDSAPSFPHWCQRTKPRQTSSACWRTRDQCYETPFRPKKVFGHFLFLAWHKKHIKIFTNNGQFLGFKGTKIYFLI